MTREDREYEKSLKAYLLECEKKFRAEHGKETDGYGADLSLELYKQYADDYINGEPWESPQTKQKNKVGINKFINFMEEEGRTAINLESLLAYRRSLVGLSPNTISQYIRRLNTSLNWMVGMRLIKENPIPKSMLTNEKYQKAKPVLSKAELFGILNGTKPEELRVGQFVRNRAMAILLVTSGMRESELLALTPADLRWEEGSIVIKSGKGSKARTVPLMGIAKQAVKEYMERERPEGAGNFDPIFVMPDGDGFKPMSVSTFGCAIKSFLTHMTGRDDLSAHSLRHSCATFLISNGMNARDLQAILGHSSLNTTQRYAQLLAPDTMPIEHAKDVFSGLLFTNYAKRQAEEERLKRKPGPKPKQPVIPEPELPPVVITHGRKSAARIRRERPKLRYIDRHPSTR